MTDLPAHIVVHRHCPADAVERIDTAACERGSAVEWAVRHGDTLARFDSETHARARAGQIPGSEVVRRAIGPWHPAGPSADGGQP